MRNYKGILLTAVLSLTASVGHAIPCSVSSNQVNEASATFSSCFNGNTSAPVMRQCMTSYVGTMENILKALGETCETESGQTISTESYKEAVQTAIDRIRAILAQL